MLLVLIINSLQSTDWVSDTDTDSFWHLSIHDLILNLNKSWMMDDDSNSEYRYFDSEFDFDFESSVLSLQGQQSTCLHSTEW